MFLNWKDYFSGQDSLQIDATGILSDQDLQVAVIALLVAVGRADADFSKDELNEIIKQAGAQFKIEEKESATLMQIAGFMMDEDSGKLFEFIAAVREKFDEAQRMRLMGLVWKVILADGKIDREETEIAAALRKDLDLSMEQAVRAQQLAQAGEYD